MLQADKGNATVIMNSTNYDHKVHNLIDDLRFYSRLSKDPTRTTERNLLLLLRTLHKEEKIDKSLYEN